MEQDDMHDSKHTKKPENDSAVEEREDFVPAPRTGQQESL